MGDLGDFMDYIVLLDLLCAEKLKSMYKTLFFTLALNP